MMRLVEPLDNPGTPWDDECYEDEEMSEEEAELEQGFCDEWNDNQRRSRNERPFEDRYVVDRFDEI